MRYNVVRELEFRAHFLLWILIDIMWVMLQVIVIDIYFTFTDNIAGWTRAEVLALMGIFRIIKGFFDVFVRPNLFAFPDIIGRGELDYTLTKPVSSLFMVSLKRHQFNQSATIFMGVGILVYSFVISPVSFGVWDFLQLLLLVVLGLISFYAIFLAFSTLSIYLTRLSAVSAFYDVVSNVMRYPTDALGYHAGFATTLLFPLAAVATLPAQLVLGKVSELQLVIEIALSVGAFSLAYRFWKFSLRHYSSASS